MVDMSLLAAVWAAVVACFVLLVVAGVGRLLMVVVVTAGPGGVAVGLFC